MIYSHLNSYQFQEHTVQTVAPLADYLMVSRDMCDFLLVINLTYAVLYLHRFAHYVRQTAESQTIELSWKAESGCCRIGNCISLIIKSNAYTL